MKAHPIWQKSLLISSLVLGAMMAGCQQDESTASVQAVEAPYSGNIRISLASPVNPATNDFWIVMSTPADAELGAVCLVDSIDQCKKTQNDVIDPVAGKKVKRFFELDKKGVKNGRAFFKSKISAIISPNLVLTFVYWTKDPTTKGYQTADVRYVMFNQDGSTSTTGGAANPTGSSFPPSSTVTPTTVADPDSIVRNHCSNAGCHSGGGYASVSSLPKADAASRITSGNMPRGNSLTADERAALLKALN